MSETTTTPVSVQMEGEAPPAEPVVATVEPLPPIPGRNVVIRFERTIRPADYESKKCGAEVSFEIPSDFPIDRLSELVENEYMMLSSAVYQQLGIEFTLDPDARVLIEAFPGSNVVQAAPAPARQAPVAPATAASPFAGAAAPVADRPFGGAPTQPGWAELVADPSQWEDCRQTKTNPKAPDFKHLTAKNAKGYAVGLWINDKTPLNAKQFLGLA